MRAKVRPALARQARKINDLQRRVVQVRTGATQASIGYAFGNSPVGQVHSRTSLGGRGVRGSDPDLIVMVYAGGEGPDDKGWTARFLEYGTAPHRSHPGTKPQPFFWPAVRLLRKDSQRNIARAFNRAVKAAGLMTNKARGRHAPKDS